jgi:hypothetical protein
MVTKYRLTDTGYENFIANKLTYRSPTVVGKLMFILSLRVGYTLDSLTSQIAQDPRIDSSNGSAVIREVNNLIAQGYIEVYNI